MTAPDTLQRFGLELFLEPETVPSPADCIPIFHRWIRERALAGLLIDVADYRHLVDGPRALLVGHEGNVALDAIDGRVGLLYSAKRVPGETLVARLEEAARRALTAARLLEEDGTLTPRPRFDPRRIELVSNDRLLAPPGEESAERLGRALEALGSRLHPDATTTIEPPSGSARDRLRLALTSADGPTLSVLLERLTS